MAGLIDYAGLLPPTSASMLEAVTRYADYRRGPDAWILGRFIVPSGRIAEFEEATRELLPTGPHTVPWQLGVVASDDVDADLTAVDRFNARHAPAIEEARRPVRMTETTGTAAPQGAVAAASSPATITVGAVAVEGLEVKADSADDVRRISELAISSVRLWFELPQELPSQELGMTLKAVMRLGNSVMLRTGGASDDAMPAAQTVAEFLLAFIRAGTFCRATGGLHHPLRTAPSALMSGDGPPAGGTHGFVNVFLAAALLRELVMAFRPDAEIVEAVAALLEESDATALAWHDDHVAWHDHRLDVHALEMTRLWFARGFESCSFDGPIAELQQLGLL